MAEETAHNDGITIAEIRATTGMSRKAFAERFSIPYRTVEDWEAEKRTPPVYVKMLLAAACGLIKMP